MRADAVAIKAQPPQGPFLYKSSFHSSLVGVLHKSFEVFFVCLWGFGPRSRPVVEPVSFSTAFCAVILQLPRLLLSYSPCRCSVCLLSLGITLRPSSLISCLYALPSWLFSSRKSPSLFQFPCSYTAIFLLFQSSCLRESQRFSIVFILYCHSSFLFRVCSTTESVVRTEVHLRLSWTETSQRSIRTDSFPTVCIEDAVSPSHYRFRADAPPALHESCRVNVLEAECRIGRRSSNSQNIAVSNGLYVIQRLAYFWNPCDLLAKQQSSSYMPSISWPP